MDHKHVAAKSSIAVDALNAKASILAGLGESVIYLMGISFVLGCLFTILLLLLLDFMKRDRVAPEVD